MKRIFQTKFQPYPRKGAVMNGAVKCALAFMTFGFVTSCGSIKEKSFSNQDSHLSGPIDPDKPGPSTYRCGMYTTAARKTAPTIFTSIYRGSASGESYGPNCHQACATAVTQGKAKDCAYLKIHTEFVPFLKYTLKCGKADGSTIPWLFPVFNDGKKQPVKC